MAATLRLVVAVLLGALLVALAYQVPANHVVDIGGYDAAYVQGFYDASRADAPAAPAYLAGADGRARWTNAASFLLFPQIGLPAELALRLRAAPNAPANQRITVLLNGSMPLGEIAPTADWREYRYTVNAGITKPSDVVIELRASQVAPVSAEDSREVGVLLDRAALRTTAWPILPYPWPIAFGALAGMLVWALFEQQETNDERRTTKEGIAGFRRSPFVFRLSQPNGALLIVLLIALLFLLLYRLQPPYPYPLRWLLPGIDLALAALVALRYAPVVARRFVALPDVAAAAVALAWVGAIILAARQHLVLSVPGVEKDFSVFALRSAQLFGTFQPSGTYDALSDGVVRADGFYNIGYPLLLWLVRPLTFGNPFLAAQIVAATSGVLLLLATWWLARRLLGANGGLVALACLAFSPLVAEYGLYLGTDMPFAAACALALALLVGGRRTTNDGGRGHLAPTVHRPPSTVLLLAAGLAAGAAFLVRHPGIVLLPFGWLAMLVAAWRGGEMRHVRMPLGLFTLGFFVAALPQLAVNARDTGNPLWSEQAKNIWLAAYGNGDWANWPNAPDTISLGDVVLSDPARFFGNWATNLRGFLGAGGEDVSEFGRADQLRLLAFPANWLAIAALGAWLFRGGMPFRLLLAWAALYALGVTVGLSLVRFALPLAPVYAIAAAWSALWLGRKLAEVLAKRPVLAGRAPFAVALLLVALIFSGIGIGTGFVLRNQPAEDLAAVQLLQRTVAPGQRVRMEIDPRVPFDEYSAVAHLVAQAGQAAAFVLRPSGQPMQPGETVVGSANGYSLYRIES